MKELISYLRAKYERKNESASFEQIKEKFKDKDVEKLLDQLLKEGIIFEPRPRMFRYLG